MEDPQSIHNISVIWRGKKFTLQMNPSSTLKDLGHEMQKLTHIKTDTMRFIVPQFSNKSSQLLTPFSNEHERLSLQETFVTQGKPIRMMGVSENEVDEVLQGTKENSRIAGFDEEEKRLRQRISNRPQFSQQLPQGPYIFCDFRTLQLPGIELNPPASEALKRMHMLAADPGIVAIMNKHRWRVGIMTEMAPVGYVGISPKCVLGFNKNNGEEISLRLRTDDLKGFRKYGSIKKTLLHELAHMVYSEHDANFFNLNRQLTQEADSLDWTRSRSHTLSGVRHSDHFEEEEEFYDEKGSHFSQKLGGNVSDQLENARMASVAAAYRRMENASTYSLGISEVHEEPDPDDSGLPTRMNVGVEEVNSCSLNEVCSKPYQELDLDDFGFVNKSEPDPDDSGLHNKFEPDPDDSGYQNEFEPDPDDSSYQNKFEPDPDYSGHENKFEPDPDESETSLKHCIVAEPGTFHSKEMNVQGQKNIHEPDPDDLEVKMDNFEHGNVRRPEDNVSLISNDRNIDYIKDDPSESQEDSTMLTEPDPDDNLVQSVEPSIMQIDEPDPDDEELQRIQDPVAALCGRLQKAIKGLRAEIGQSQATIVLQTLFKIISNVIEHPEEIKFRRLRKANPIIQRNIANYKAAIEILVLIGFYEDLVSDEVGKTETYLVLKRNDPGLLWLAKSCLEPNLTS
ncbi:uncharacterized protein LOC115699071 [Cannabis sativa]|uniref:WLM domain-containing protein n=3 Tax=Cannabis sativa TaxID=3483 RepID=A0AB40EBI0_CANSA|nr:uncharacterized protein LOC115699071 [Cannabis sativa]KAF4368239.1 hypothetical protein F8388_022872 [Cannabis sativa]KAF4396381.1 hypothetical protein G4B88_019181 [Cannabis sativa]